MSLRPGDAFAFQFTTQDSTGAATNADGTPTGTVVKNGTDDATPTVTVTNPSTGVYKASLTVPVGYVAGDVFQVRVAATVSGVTAKATTSSIVLDTKRASDTLSAVLTAAGLDLVLVESSISASSALTNDSAAQLTSINARQALALLAAAIDGVLAGAATTNITIKPAGKPAGNTRVDATVDAAGNRSALTLKVPD